MSNTPNINELEQKVNDSFLSPDDKQEILDVLSGQRLANLYRDAIAKRIFSPDEHPERLDFLLQRIMNDSSIETLHSASNEGALKSIYSKKIITDIPTWIKDHRRSDLEIQSAAQEYIYNRADIYSSEMLMVQYSTSERQDKDEIGYGNINGVIIVVLMVKSPKVFKEYDSPRYIHRITKAISDSGMVFPMLRQMAFVQLDKALEQYVTDTYNEDEDYDLLKLLAMIADINNDKVAEAIRNDKFLNDIRNEVAVFSQNKEVQAMLLEEKMAVLDWEANRNDARREGRAEGRAEGQIEIREVFDWLYESGRGDDVRKAVKDNSFYQQCLSEYKASKTKK